MDLVEGEEVVIIRLMVVEEVMEDIRREVMEEWAVEAMVVHIGLEEAMVEEGEDMEVVVMVVDMEEVACMVVEAMVELARVWVFMEVVAWVEDMEEAMAPLEDMAVV
jgi:hypothetical protein